jgi:hypothetical protein
MPREALTITPLHELTLPAINEFITQLNQRMTAISTMLTTIEGLDGNQPKLFNDLDMQAHAIRGIKSINFSDPITLSPIQSFVLTKPSTIPVANASASLADISVLRDEISTRMLPTIAAALDTLRVQMNTILARLR